MKSKINYKMYEGGEVLQLDRAPLLKREDLKLQEEYLIPTLFGYVKMKISKIDGDGATAESLSLLSDLCWSKDERKTWTSDVAIDKKAIVRVVMV